jgi:hypothetical protein
MSTTLHQDESDNPESDGQDGGEQFKATYAYLRAGVVVVVVLLAAGVIIDSIVNKGIRESISAYFYGSAGSIFVGALAAAGIAMLAYQGNLESEDHLLNFSGTLAFLVAVIPTPSDSAPDLMAIRTGVLAVLIAFVLALLANWYVLKRAPFPKNELLAKVAAIALGVWFVFYAFLVLTNVPLLSDIGHKWAAIPMFIAIVLVAILNALGTSEERFRNWYIAVAIIIPLGLIAVWMTAAWGGLKQGVFWAETVVILAFSVFWVVQTVELTTKPRRPPKPEGSSALLEKLTKSN